MGYYSKVVCRVHGNKEMLLDVLVLLKLRADSKKYDHLQEVLDDCKVVESPHDPSNALFSYEEENIKWYDSYEYVQAFMSIWRSFADQEPKFSGGFIRIGEDKKDIEEMYIGECGEDLVWVKQDIGHEDFAGPNLLISKIESSPINTQGTT